MKKHKEIVEYLKARGLRLTPSKKVIIQFFLDNKNRHVSFKELQDLIVEKLPDVDKTTIYRNIEKFIAVGFIQEINLPTQGKVYEYIYGKKVQHYYICKCCGKINKGNKDLFDKIESALKDVHDFSKANLSVVFYGLCASCEKSFAPIAQDVKI